MTGRVLLPLVLVLAFGSAVGAAEAAGVAIDEKPESPSADASAPSEKPSAGDQGDSEKAEADAGGDAEAGDEESPSSKDGDAKDGETDGESGEEPDAEPDKDEAEGDDAEGDDRKTHTVEPKRLKVDVTINGAFVSRQMTEIVLRPEAWSRFEIVEIVEHGAEVKRGDTLVRFDEQPLDEAIAELELTQRLDDLSLMRAEQELPRIEKLLDMELKDAQQRNEYANEDYKEFRDKGRENMLASTRMMVAQYRMALEEARDELKQLQKMYEADDLTEETEEIVLKRQRQMVDIYERIVAMVEYQADLSENTYMPRNDESLADSVERIKLSLDRTRAAHKLDLNRARYELERRRQRRAKSLDRHADLTADRGLMRIAAPASGVVYYGKSVRGKWSDLGSMLTKLKPGASASKNQVLMTLVDPEDLCLVGLVDEKHLPSVAVGQPVLARPTAEGSRPLAAAVARVSAVPVSAGKYEVEVKIKTEDLPEWLDPGMTGKLKITTYDNHQALVVPKKAVHTDEFDETVRYVWLVAGDPADDTSADDKPADDAPEGRSDRQGVEKRLVRVGVTKGDDVEIVDGLKSGDVVSLENEEEDENTKG